jgi:hypothetical protein
MGRLLSTAEVSRSDRLKADAAELNEQTAFDNFFKTSFANVFLQRFGVQLIANREHEHIDHVYEEWPGMDRRRISGSVYRQTKLFFLQGGMGVAWLDPGPLGTILRQCRRLAVGRGAPVALARQGARESRSFLLEQSTEYPGAAIGLGGATPQELRLSTISHGKLNAAIMDLRDADPAVVAADRAYERSLGILDELIPGHRKTPWGHMAEAWANRPNKRKIIDIGSRGPASNCYRHSSDAIEAINTQIRTSGASTDRGIAAIVAVALTGADRARLEEIPARRGELPRYYVVRRPFLFEQVKKPNHDPRNIFDHTGAGRDDGDAIFNPLGLDTLDKSEGVQIVT